ncbi:efflux transporter periplasmic adaptor subunit [Laribacter hongkongensis]|uniref:efflux RND transporter periplasmic adaptor subunit n=1 Tax=Laribacter hongkongensis TaxID=168471 RepID=UPI001877E496|nr:efflux RND transporter periplasmic adaptor subunit [Laribacter hongkongensis]MBE5529751.1 efflux transporter periplasmic adaptor subunit [Laribacter hongkongensis]MCG9089995.1 efflux RND transporter periplasmic adaptor subunit [Laribacter hongkongensis]
MKPLLSHRTRTALLLPLAALLAACNDQTAQPSAPPPEVSVITTRAADVPVSFQYVGQVAGFRDIQIRGRVNGILLKRLYQEGQSVKAGTPLFQIDPEPYQVAVERARAALAVQQASLMNADLNYKRIVPLYKENAVSQKDRDDALATFEAAKAAVAQAKAALHEAEINLGYTLVTAPISGLTNKAAQSEGSLISASSAEGSLLTSMSQIDPIYVNFAFSENESIEQRKMEASGKLIVPPEKKFDVQLTLGDGSTYSRTGTMNFTDNVVDPTTGTISARALFQNPDSELRPGQYARVTLKGYQYRDAITIPQKAVLTTQQGKIVMLVGQDNKVSPRPVTLGQEVNNDVLVLSGLKPGERVIVEGLVKARPGQPVRIVPLTPPPAAAKAPAAKPDAAQPEKLAPSAK